MKPKPTTRLCIIALSIAIILPSCTKTRQNDFAQYDFSLKNTLSVFLLNNKKGFYFCIPVQYVGDYQITGFEFDNGNIQIGNYNILLERDKVNIFVHLNETDDMMSQYDIFIEKYLTDKDLKSIINEYKGGNVYSKLAIWYDITIDNEEQKGSGMLDDFELYQGPINEYVWLLPHFEFFRARYLQDP